MSLLQAEEPPAFEIVNIEGQSPLLLLCDHASNRIPAVLQQLGLDSHQLQQHIAWDPGAGDVARLLAKYLDATLVLSNYSRLVIDCNRPLQSSESIPEQSAGIVIPGNLNLTDQQRQSRIATLFSPYHQAITTLLNNRHKPVALLSIHSFTPVLYGHQRPWNIGVSFFQDDKVAQQLYAALNSEPIVVGFNQPYAIEVEYDYGIPVHGANRNIPAAMIEIRQDGIDSQAGILFWAKRLADACQKCFLQI